MPILPRPPRPDRFAPAPWSTDHPDWRALDQRLPADHLARRLDDAVALLDLAPVHACYGPTGSAAHSPQRLLCAVLYELRQGRPSPAQWCRDAREAEPLRWLLRGTEPARSCWYAFRDRIAGVLDDLNRQVLAQAQAQTQTPAVRGALDGTSVAAHASRRRLVNEATLRRRREQLQQALVDPPVPLPSWIAPSLRGRQQQQGRLQQAQEIMAQRQRQNGQKRASKRRAAEKIVLSVTDPEAALGYDKEGVYRPLYNVQILDDLDSPLILAYDVFAQPNDAGLLSPMLQRAEHLLGHRVETILADTAYAGGAAAATAAAAGVTLYAPLPAEPKTDGGRLPKSAFAWRAEAQTYECPQGHRLVHQGATAQKRSGTETVRLHQYRCPPVHCQGCPLQSACTKAPQRGRTISRSEHEESIEALRARRGTPEAQRLYRQRRQTVELVNADWKVHRQLRRFVGRGLRRVRAQVALTVLVHNLLAASLRKAEPADSQRSRTA
jgi:transposase